MNAVPQNKFRHSVYVLLLDQAALKQRSVLRRNPHRDASMPCVYVGMTGLPIDQRIQNHKNGYKSAAIVRNHYVRRMPELYEHLNPMSYKAAAQKEREVAEQLRTEGYTVAGGT